ncbi:unnamed protein product, partial [Thelazia callipaeda]|uniref:LRRCT domain-containing protein n=1 Tax=Thelazia callipaeda TaxID=103827 RepID=A0A0N5CKR3_THECL
MPQMCREESDLQSSSQSTSQEMKAHSRMTTFSSSMFAFSLRQFFTSVKYADKEKQETKKDSPLFSDTRNKVRPNHMLTINNLIFLLYPLILFTTTQATRFDSIIPGCPDLRSIAEIDSYNGSFCFCDALDENEVSISCLYGSSVQQLQTVINAIEKVNKTLRKITLTRMEFDNATLPASLFHSSLALIQTISKFIIKQLKQFFLHLIYLKSIINLYLQHADKCIHIGPLKIHPSAFYGVEQTLEELSITDCKLEEFPREAIHNLTNLKSLSLAHNKLTYLEINDLQSLKKSFSSSFVPKELLPTLRFEEISTCIFLSFNYSHLQLEALNLEGNFISSLEKGALSTLRNSLHILSYGSHNFVNDSIFEEISQLNELQVLDMNNADGITDIAPGTFLGLSKLEKLLLAGCSLTAIHNETFQGLTKLTELDLRINLLNKIACGSFISTPNLRRLSLAGNYLNESFPCWWNGMKNLKDLDLGWNELAVLENDIFVELGSTLAFLNLRHNKKLVKIADDAFNGLIYVSRLNMSAVSITQLNNTLRHLSSLK